MLIDKLRDYYGFPEPDQVDYITKRTLGMTEAQQNEIAEKIIQSRQKRFGFPDISILARFLSEAGTKKHKCFYWAVCDDCKAEYDYRFESCPKCHLAGKRSSGYKVRTSENGIPANVIRWNQTTFHPDGKRSSGYKVRTSDYQPPAKVIRWNQTTLRPEPGKTYCVNCANRDNNSYCRWFGNPEHTCAREEYEYCECKKCCVIHKKGNARLVK